jgi:hypothetical protein
MTSSLRRACRLVLAGLGVAVLGWGTQCEPARAQGDATQTSVCANEGSPGFRASLPDCRANELVTPPYAGGSAVLWSEREQPPVSSDGQHVLGQSLAGFGGVGDDENNGSQFGAIYEFSRTASGWTDEPLNPPASMYARQRFVAASADLQRTLWRVDSQSGPEEEVASAEAFSFIEREAPQTPDGGAPQFSSIDAPPESQFVGASEDLSTILFESADQLYETHLGEVGAPRLLGVVEHGELASKCATTLGTGGDVGPTLTGASAYNAVSSDGSTVFFTAAACADGPIANDLYVQHAYSRPINLSEPSADVCAQCDTSEPQEAVFEGASSDGSKAFFLSAQALLPGAEGQSLYEYDAESPVGQRLMLVAPNAAGVVRISEDGSHAYFVSTSALATTPEGRAGCVTEPCRPVSEQDNLYSLATLTGRVAFVATLASADARDWMQEDSGRPAETTPDGEFLLFPSVAQLTPDDSSGEEAPQLFEYDSETEALARVSIGHEDYGEDGNTSVEADAPKLANTPQFEAATRPTDRWSLLSLTAGGDVFFTSADQLVPGAVAGRENIYEYDHVENDVYLISAGDEAAPLASGTMPRYLGTDESGEDVFFLTAESLVPQDIDTQASWYDARVGGGFPGPIEVTGCQFGICEGSRSTPPQPPATGGSEAAAPEEPAAPPPASTSDEVKPKAPAKTTSRAEKLAKALRACKKDPKKLRRACEAHAREVYGTKGKPTKHARTHR